MKKYKALTDEEAELASCHLDEEGLEHYDGIKDTIRRHIMTNMYDLAADLEDFTHGFAGETVIKDTIVDGAEYEIEMKIKRIS